MKRWLILGTVVAASLGAAADTTVAEHCAVQDAPRILLKCESGSVKIHAGETPEVRLTGTIEEGIERVDFHCDNGEVKIEVVRGSILKRKHQAHLQLLVPAVSHLEITTTSAPVVLAGITGRHIIRTVSGEVAVEGDAEELDIKTTSGTMRVAAGAAKTRLRTISGDVALTRNAGTLEVSTVSGEAAIQGDYGEVRLGSTSGRIQLEGAAQEVEAETVSGDITIGQVSGKCEMRSVSGDLTFGASSLQHAALQTVSGDVSMAGTLDARGSLEMETLSGDIQVTLPPDTPAVITAETFSGSVKNSLGTAEAQSVGPGPGVKLEYKVGEGTAAVDIESKSGDISITSK